MDEPRSPSPRAHLLALAAAALAFVAFLPALEGKFLNWDDEVNFTKNPHYRGLGAAQLKYFFTDATGHYMPLTWLTLGLDYVLWGMEPRGYHVTSLLLHAAGAFVFFFVALLLLRKALPETPDDKLLGPAFAAALFFAIHPLRTESVAWITERRDVVSGLFFMLAVWGYLKLHERAGAPRKWLYISLTAFILSLLSKAMGMMLPVVLVAIDLYPLRRVEAGRPVLPQLFALALEKLPYFVLLFVSIGLTAFVQKKATALYTIDAYPPIDIVLQPWYRMCFYVWKTAVPFVLSPYYPYRTLRLGIGPEWILGWAAVPTAAFLLWRWRRRRPGLGVAALSYAALISPVVVWQAGPHFAADRYTYLACLPFAVLFGGWVARSGTGPRWAAAGALVLLAGLSWKQSKVWQNSYQLWDHAINVGTTSHLPYISRGAAKAERNDLDGALADYKKALSIDKRDLMAWNNLSMAHRMKGNHKEAVDAASSAIRVDPKVSMPYINRGLAHAERKDYDAAVRDFTKAIEIDPKFRDTYLNRALSRFKTHDPGGAIADATKALELDPQSVKALLDRGVYRLGAKDPEGALADFGRARELDRHQPPPLLTRGIERAKADDLAGGIADYTELIRREPKNASAFAHRALSRKKGGDREGALADFAEAARLDPRMGGATAKEHARTLADRAGERLQRGDNPGALADCSEALRVQPDSHEALTYRASARANLGDFGGALEDVEAALGAAPKDWVDLQKAEGLRAQIRAQLRAVAAGEKFKKKDLRGAITDGTEAIRLHDRCVDAYIHRGNARAQLGDVKGALEDFETLLRIAPPNWPSRPGVQATIGNLRAKLPK